MVTLVNPLPEAPTCCSEAEGVRLPKAEEAALPLSNELAPPRLGVFAPTGMPEPELGGKEELPPIGGVNPLGPLIPKLSLLPLLPLPLPFQLLVFPLVPLPLQLLVLPLPAPLPVLSPRGSVVRPVLPGVVVPGEL